MILTLLINRANRRINKVKRQWEERKENGKLKNERTKWRKKSRKEIVKKREKYGVSENKRKRIQKERRKNIFVVSVVYIILCATKPADLEKPSTFVTQLVCN